MRLVMGAEPLSGPLTGIGHYTYQLTRHLMDQEEISDVQLLSRGSLASPGFGPPGHQAELQDAGTASSSGQPSAFVRLKALAASNHLLVRAYDNVTAARSHWSLRDYGPGDVLHSPNYVMPPFRGSRVVTVLDLSTVKFPQFHPSARVEFVNRHIARAVASADAIVTISEQVKQEILGAYTIDANRIHVTYLGADGSFKPLSEEQFAPYSSKFNAEYKGYFLCVSTVEPRKNLDRLLDAYEAYLEQAGPESLPLVMAGSRGWGSRHTHARLDALTRRGNVRYLGYVAQGDLPGLFAGARALLFPSLYEGFGLPVLEAMQAGTAVLTSRDSAMAEITRGAAELVDPLEVSSIAEGIQHLATDDTRVEQLGARGLEVCRDYTWANCAAQTLAVYRGL